MGDSDGLRHDAGFFFLWRLLTFLHRTPVVREAPVFAELPTPELTERAAAQIRRCHTLEQAAALLHYPEQLFVEWFNAGERRRGRNAPAPELVEWHNAISRAYAEAVGELLEDLRNAGYETKKEIRKIDVRATERLLAALDPERFDTRNVNVRLLRDSMERFVAELEDVMGADEFQGVAMAVRQVAEDVVETV